MKKLIILLSIILIVGLVGCNKEVAGVYSGIEAITLPYGGDEPIWYDSEITDREYEDYSSSAYIERVNMYTSGIHTIFLEFRTGNETEEQLIEVTIEERIDENPIIYFISSRFIILGENDSLMPNYVRCIDSQSTCSINEVENTIIYGVPGEYYVKYQAIDEDQNVSEIKTLYVQVVESETILSYGYGQVRDIYETETDLYYLLDIWIDIMIPGLVEPGPHLFLVSYINNEKNYVELEAGFVVGENCKLYVDEKISVYCLSNQNDERNIIRNDFSLDGDFIEEITIGEVDSNQIFYIGEDGLFFYIEQDYSEIKLYTYNEETNQTDMKVIHEFDNENYSYPGLIKIQNGKIYIAGLKEAEPPGPDLYLMIYDIDSNSMVTHLYEEGHVSHVYDYFVEDELSIIFELSSESSIETIYLSEIQQDTITITEEISERNFFAIVVNNDTLLFVYQEESICDTRTCIETTLVDLEGNSYNLGYFEISQVFKTNYNTYIYGSIDGINIVLKFNMDDYLSD